jgi:hypothetical protein
MPSQFIDSYYRSVYPLAQREIRSQSDSYLLSVDLEEFADYLVQKYGFSEIEPDSNRDITSEKTRRIVERNHFGETREIEELRIKISFPVEPDETIEKVLSLSPNNRSTAPPRLIYCNGWITTEVSPSETAVKQRLEELNSEIVHRNSDIRKENNNLRLNVCNWIKQRKAQIENEDALLEQISRKVEIVLKQKSGAQRIVPPTLSVKEKLRPIVKPSAKAPVKLELPRDKFYAILDLISSSCAQFERTPSTFAKLDEEELRNVILSNLNSCYEIEALGEAFSKRGKTDIYLRVQEGGAFVAECKNWAGAKTIDEAVGQILSYLTWRDSYGVVILFSKRKGFSKVLETAGTHILQLPSYSKAFRKIDESHFSGSFALAEDEHKLVELHFVIYNLCD